MTDHRIGLTLYRLGDVLNGDLDEVIDALDVYKRQPYLFDRANTERVDYILYDDVGHKLFQHALRHSFSENGIRCYEQRYSRVVPLLSESEASHGQVLCADSWLLSRCV